MKRAGFWLSVGALGLVAAIADNSEAAMMSYQFTGVVTSLWPSEQVLGESVHLGTPFSGEFVFDSNASDRYPSSPEHGAYRDSSFVISSWIGGYTWSSGGGNAGISVANDDFGKDSLGFGALAAFPVSPDLTITSMGMNLSDSTGRAFASDSIPVIPVPLTAFDGGGFQAEGRNPVTGAGFKLGGEITGFTVVPEPSFTLVVLAVVLLRWRKA